MMKKMRPVVLYNFKVELQENSILYAPSGS